MAAVILPVGKTVSERGGPHNKSLQLSPKTAWVTAGYAISNRCLYADAAGQLSSMLGGIKARGVGSGISMRWQLESIFCSISLQTGLYI